MTPLFSIINVFGKIALKAYLVRMMAFTMMMSKEYSSSMVGPLPL